MGSRKPSDGDLLKVSVSDGDCQVEGLLAVSLQLVDLLDQEDHSLAGAPLTAHVCEDARWQLKVVTRLVFATVHRAVSRLSVLWAVLYA